MNWKQNLLNSCVGFFLLALAAGTAWQSRALAVGGQAESKRVALTFDDGPNWKYTPQLLEGLKERGVVCSFFLLGQRVEVQRDLVRDMYEAGHLLGNHTYDHRRLGSLSEQEAREELEKTSALIQDITGEDCLYVRPPYGEWKDGLGQELSVIPVLWTVDSRDWSLQEPQAVVRRVVSQVQDGDIILMHDDYAASVEAALDIVYQLQKEGYTFVTVDQLVLE